MMPFMTPITNFYHASSYHGRDLAACIVGSLTWSFYRIERNSNITNLLCLCITGALSSPIGILHFGGLYM